MVKYSLSLIYRNLLPTLPVEFKSSTDILKPYAFNISYMPVGYVKPLNFDSIIWHVSELSKCIMNIYIYIFDKNFIIVLTLVVKINNKEIGVRDHDTKTSFLDRRIFSYNSLPW